ncbi:MAG: PVC-type heme-binding CxxCH protein [Planctomycetota bacterium]
MVQTRTIPILALWLQIACFSLADDVVIGERMLRVAEGYEVSLAVAPSLVARPIAVARDEKGRLYVTDSGGMSERAEKQLEEKPHCIRRVEDSDNDGVYDTSTLFADRMMFPEGCLWYEGSLYVAAPPEIWKLTDTDDDGAADRREVWFDGRTLTGCGNDLHGPYLGLDGRFYWCKGAFAEQKHMMADGTQLVTQSSHIFRAKPDGTEMESVLTGGMDNPVNVAFLKNGERFLSCTFFQHPEAGLRDGLIHTIYGGVYGKKHDSIYAHPMTGDVMPVLNHQGAAAPCGLIAGSEVLFGGGFDQHLFACYFNLHKVVNHQLIPSGPTYTTEDSDLLSCDHPDFHPTDVFEDADGSLLIVDTGGWYKVCCPTSQLAKPDVLGAVYRVRRKEAPKVTDPEGMEIPWVSLDHAGLATLLADNRLFVQRRAAAELRKRGAAAELVLAEIVKSHKSAAVRLRAVWTLAGMERLSSDALQTAIIDVDATIRQAAAHILGLHRDRNAVPALLKLAASDEPGPARAAVEALGRMQDPRVISTLMEIGNALAGQNEAGKSRQSTAEEHAAETDPRRSASLDFGLNPSGEPADPALRIREHSLIYAMIETNDAEQARLGLSGHSPWSVRAALVALNEMRDGDLKPGDVISRMSDDNEAVRLTAAWVVKQHPDWGSALSDYFTERLALIDELTDDERDQLIDQLARLASSSDIQSLLLSQIQQAGNASVRKMALHSMAQSGLSSVPTTWLEALAELIRSGDKDSLIPAIEAIQNLPLPKEGHVALQNALVTVAANESLADDLRLNAIDAAGPGIQLADGTFVLLTRSLAPDLPMTQRAIAANRLASSDLTESQVADLVRVIPSVGPMELPKLLPAFEQHPTEEQGMKLVDSLLRSAGVRGLRPDLVRPLLMKYPVSVQSSGKALTRMLNASEEEQTAQLESMLAMLPEGDVRRGHEVFMSRKAACQSCHKLGYGGGRLGPDLTRIGSVRNRRDLLEALMFPSASIVRGYEPVSAELHDGRVLSGIITSESAEEVVLSQDAQKVFHLARTDIASIHPSNVSPMPNGLTTLLTQQELADLITFLLSDQR